MARYALGGTYDDGTLLRWLEVFLRRFFAQQFKRSCLPDGPKIGSAALSPRGDWRMPSDASAALWLRGAEALKQAQKISRKAASAGFEWETVDDVWAKVDEEVAELKAAYAAAPKSANGKVDAAADPAAAAAVELEMGDVLFSLVNVARKMGVQAEEALRATCGKFRTRWAFMEGAAAGGGRRVEDLSMEEMEELWQLSKVLEGDSLG